MFVLLFVMIAGGSALGLYFGNSGLRAGKRRGGLPKGSMEWSLASYWRGYAWGQVFGGAAAMATGLIFWAGVLFPVEVSEELRVFSNVLGAVVLVGVGVVELWWGRNIAVVDAERRGDGSEVWWSRRRLATAHGIWLIVAFGGAIIAFWPS